MGRDEEIIWCLRQQKLIEVWENTINKPQEWLWEHELGWLDLQKEIELIMASLHCSLCGTQIQNEKEYIKHVSSHSNENWITTQEYSDRASALESNDFGKIHIRLAGEEDMRLLHAVIGICTETGELQDIVKRNIFYGKSIDKVHLKEELGDLMWYMNLIIKQEGWTWEEVMQRNIEKLEHRYAGKKFTETQALNRDLPAERKILEKE